MTMDECHHPVHPPGHPEFSRARVFSHVFLNESDRGAILVCAEILSGMLEERLSLHIIDDADIRQAMLGREAPFGTFSARIVGAYALGLIDLSVRKRLDQIRRIRNQCAHHILDITFLDQRIRDIVLTMKEPKASPQDPTLIEQIAPDERSRLRFRFVMGCSEIATAIALNTRDAEKIGPPREGQWFLGIPETAPNAASDGSNGAG
jgi:DNA-binding MltR family transcriptional regulator